MTDVTRPSVDLGATASSREPWRRALPEGPATFLGKALWLALPGRRRIAAQNIERALSSRLSRDQQATMLAAHFDHLARVLIELIVSRLSPWRVSTGVRIEGLEGAKREFDRGKGILLLGLHAGNWEAAPRAVLDFMPQYRGRVVVIRRPLYPALLNALVRRRFEKAGIRVLPERGCATELMRHLRDGNIVLYPFDQHAAGREGVVVPFFGSPASTFRAPAVLAQATGCPVVVVATRREPDGSHVVRFAEPSHLRPEPTREATTVAATAAYNRTLEKLIMLRPEQWFWLHRRWKPNPRAAGGMS